MSLSSRRTIGKSPFGKYYLLNVFGNRPKMWSTNRNYLFEIFSVICSYFIQMYVVHVCCRTSHKRKNKNHFNICINIYIHILYLQKLESTDAQSIYNVIHFVAKQLKVE